MTNFSFILSSIALAAAALLAGCSHGNPASSPTSSTTAKAVSVTPVAAATSGPPPASGEAASGKTLTDPSGDDLFLLHYCLSGADPAFPELAKLDSKVRSADEFTRNSVAANIEKQLRARAAEVCGTGHLVIDLSDRFGEFDDKYKEYSFTMRNGSVITLASAFGRAVEIVLTNGGLARTWKIEPQDAQDVLRRTKGNRSAVLALKLDVLNAVPAFNSAPLTINARIVEYEIRSETDNLRLGNVVVN
jgi:hypothetical protein